MPPKEEKDETESSPLLTGERKSPSSLFRDSHHQQYHHYQSSINDNGDDDDEESAGAATAAVDVSLLHPHPAHPCIWKDELQSLIGLSLPVIGTYLLEMLPGITSIILVGHITTTSNQDNNNDTEQYIDATALAVMYMALVALSVGFGLSSALDTLCSQAHGANQGHVRIGTYFQTGILVLGAFFTIPVTILFWYCPTILIALGQPPHIATLAGTFVMWLLPGIPFLFLYELLRKVLQAQNIVQPMLYASIAANIVNILLGYYLIFYTTYWGWLGAAAARTASNMTFIFVLVPYVLWYGNRGDGGAADVSSTDSTNTTAAATTAFTISSSASTTSSFYYWNKNGFEWNKAIQGVPQFLQLGIPGMLQLCFEWWAFEVLSLICGLLPNAVVSIGANAIALNVASMTYMFYLGLSISCNVRVGNALGAQDPYRAKMAAQLTLGMAIIIAMGNATVLASCRYKIPNLLTKDPTINDMAAQVMIVAAIFQIPDAVNGTIQGIFRGSGRQSLGAQLNFAAYYLLGIPLGCMIAFMLHQGVIGLWVGMTASLLLVAVVGVAIVQKSDWTLLAERAAMRIQNRILEN